MLIDPFALFNMHSAQAKLMSRSFSWRFESHIRTRVIDALSGNVVKFEANSRP